MFETFDLYVSNIERSGFKPMLQASFKQTSEAFQYVNIYNYAI